MSFSFRILGPVEVLRIGCRIPPGSAKQRAMLATLILNANRQVTLERLRHTLWTDDPPKSAVANLRTYAARLRQTLAAPDGTPKSRLVTGSLCYTLVTKPGEVDAEEFDELSAKGQDAARDGDAGQAVRCFERALGLWRGAAGDGLACSPVLATLLSALNERRLSVAEELADSRLAIGDHVKLIADLRVFLAQHPMRERSWAQLMLALYRSGRPAEALAAFGEARAVLLDQLGMDPGKELVALHQKILCRSDSLESGHRPAAHTSHRPLSRNGTAHLGGTVPRQLPAAVPVLVGRAVELAGVRGALRQDHSAAASGGRPAVVVVHGPAGVGKSALAIAAARDVAGTFPDGQLYVDIGGTTGGQDIPHRLLRALGAPHEDIPGSQELAAASLRSLLAELRVLVLVDNVTNAAQLRPLVPSVRGSALLATSPNYLTALDGVTHLRLGRLSQQATVVLLDTLLEGGRVAREPAAAAEIARFCDHLPLAVRIAAARLATRPFLRLAAFAAVLADERQRLDQLQIDDLSLRDRLAASYAPLAASSDPDDALAALLCARLGRLPGCVSSTVDAAVAATLLQVTTSATESALDRLVRAHLLEVVAPGHYQMTDTVRLFAADLPTPELPW